MAQNMFSRTPTNNTDLFRQNGTTANIFSNQSRPTQQTNQTGSNNWYNNTPANTANPFAPSTTGTTTGNSTLSGTTYGTTYNTQVKLGTYRIGPTPENLKWPMGNAATMHKAWNEKNFPMSFANF
jgi:hypothetical protein